MLYRCDQLLYDWLRPAEEIAPIQNDLLNLVNLLFGKAVIIAARIASHARGGEIVVSARVKELAEESGEFRFGTGRAATLKGLAGTYEVFEITW